ncbi:acyl carrier protein [Rugosimonospora africana]|uniref:acyl carrier protein n=1 Tax=Rugosimonospora africana TaxID=556532 RepID=UPI001EF341CE|nr:acyl carrier protein [Rugosimonospora africana]
MTGLVARHVERPPMEIDRDVPLSEYGLDSVYVLALCADIEDHWGVSVEPTLMWDYPTIAGFGNALLELINESRPVS